MHDFTTEFIRCLCLSSGMDPTELFRSHLEKAIHHHSETERTAFLDYEKWDPIGYNSGNSRKRILYPQPQEHLRHLRATELPRPFGRIPLTDNSTSQTASRRPGAKSKSGCIKKALPLGKLPI